jgi:hypothetical protein
MGPILDPHPMGDITSGTMDAPVICTHCQVAMTSWSAPGSPIRYYQCPFCARTHASCYRELYARGAGARLAASPPIDPAEPAGAGDEAVSWSTVKARAARWFARLEAAELGPPPRSATPLASRQAGSRPAPAPLALAARPARQR